MSSSTLRESFLPPLWVLTLLGLFFTFWLLSELREIVVLLVLSYAVAYIFHPILKWLESKKIRRPIAIVLVMLSMLFFIVMLLFSAVPTILEEYHKLSQNLPDYIGKAKERFLPLFDSVKRVLPKDFTADLDIREQAFNLLPLINKETLNSILGGIITALLHGYSITLTLVNLVLLPFMVFYIAVDFESLHSRVLKIFPTNMRDKVRDYFCEINSYVSAFVRGQLLVCTILFFLYAIGLAWVGVDLWLLLAVISSFGNLVPYIGFLVGIVLCSIMALVTFGDFYHLVQVWAVFAVIQTIESFFITPKVIGNSVGLSPLVIIIALFAGGQLFGLLGLFLAIPAAAIIRVSMRYLHSWVLGKSKVKHA